MGLRDKLFILHNAQGSFLVQSDPIFTLNPETRFWTAPKCECRETCGGVNVVETCQGERMTPE